MTKEELKKKLVSAISLGCDKNRVDLECMLGKLNEYGFTITDDVENSDILIVNTCAFIQPAMEEAIYNILYAEKLKKNGNVEKVIVTGCFPERGFAAMQENFPQIDRFLRLRENENICQIVEELYGVEKSKLIKNFDRILTTTPSYAYLKIADGCNNVCSYCTIPRIRGRYKSTPIDDLVDEAKELVKRGVKELILVAQDTTRYGEDLYGENALIKLCDKLSKIKDLKWIRLHYAYPEKVTDELLSYIAKNPKMCKYLDLPLQHIDDQILRSMRRRLGEDETRSLIEKIKTNYPQIALRTTFIVGYPGEKRKDFNKLLDFIKKSEFDYAGFFPYYREENTASYFMNKQLPRYIKAYRLKKIARLQHQIATSRMQSQIGKKITVLVDSFDENSGEFCCHSEKLSPTVDFGIKIIDNGNVKLYDFIEVKLTDFDGSNFKGEVV